MAGAFLDHKAVFDFKSKKGRTKVIFDNGGGKNFSPRVLVSRSVLRPGRTGVLPKELGMGGKRLVFLTSSEGGGRENGEGLTWAAEG